MGTAAAFLACYCPLCLSAPGKPSDPGIPSKFLPAEPGIQQGASRRSHVLVHVDPRDALVHHSHTVGHLLQRHPPPDGNRRAARQSPGQYRRLTHAHAAATGGTRHRAPAPNLHTASNGPRGIGDGRRQASSSLSARATHVSRSATQATQTAHGPQRPAELRCPVSSPRERREAAHVFLACHQQAARPPASIPAGHRPPASTRNRPSPGTLRYFPAVLPPSSDVAILPLGKDARTSWRMWRPVDLRLLARFGSYSSARVECVTFRTQTGWPATPQPTHHCTTDC